MRDRDLPRHADHHGGLEGLVRRRGRSRLPLLIHPDAWRERRIVFPTGGEVRLPPPCRQDLEREGLEVVEERAQSMLVDGTVLVSGQVERVTDFERGFPIHEALGDDGWACGLFEQRIEPTVEALGAAHVGRIVAAHCSGWRAVHAIARAMPEAFVQSAVGTTVSFG